MYRQDTRAWMQLVLAIFAVCICECPAITSVSCASLSWLLLAGAPRAQRMQSKHMRTVPAGSRCSAAARRRDHASSFAAAAPRPASRWVPEKAAKDLRFTAHSRGAKGACLSAFSYAWHCAVSAKRLALAFNPRPHSFAGHTPAGAPLSRAKFSSFFSMRPSLSPDVSPFSRLLICSAVVSNALACVH